MILDKRHREAERIAAQINAEILPLVLRKEHPLAEPLAGIAAVGLTRSRDV